MPASGESSQARWAPSSRAVMPMRVRSGRASELAADPRTAPSRTAWLDTTTVALPHDGPPITATIFGFGVAVAAIAETRDLGSIAELATWRRDTHARTRDAVAAAFATAWPGLSATPEYVLSCYWLLEHAWAATDLDTAVRLLSVPSVLLDHDPTRSTDELLASANVLERDRLRCGLDHPNIQSFGVDGVDGVAIGYASWSGVAYAPLSPTRAIQPRELIDLETVVQGLWAYTDHPSQVARTGADQEVPDSWSWRFLRSAVLELTTARPRETNQERMMRDAILDTSRLTHQLQDTQEFLRETRR